MTKILAIDTSCDETSAAVTDNLSILSNIIWSQASLHTQYGGVLPSLAQREHKARIDFVIQKALTSAQCLMPNISAVAVTQGPGLAIALEVGISKAKELAIKYHKPLIAVNHIEGHLLSPLANFKFQISNFKFPALGLVISGGHTELIKINKIGDYEILTQTQDDALGEALDKAARMLGLGYPGGAILEKMAKLACLRRQGDPKSYALPLPMAGKEQDNYFSYSGLKTAFYRLVEKEKPLTKEKIYNLAVSFQSTAFRHLIRVSSLTIRSSAYSLVPSASLLVGGGVAANVEVRKRIRKMAKEFGIKALFPNSKKLYGDNAAMIGIAAYFKFQRKEFVKDIASLDRLPRFSISDIGI
jgi:N6-L-threonylcarbamoyladenine synthase